MPRIQSPNNYAGLDARPGGYDAIQNAGTSISDITFVDKTIKKRKGHERAHTNQIRHPSICFDERIGSLIHVNDWGLDAAFATGGASFELAIRFTKLAAAGSVTDFLSGALICNLTSAGKLVVGMTSAAVAVVHTSVATLAVDTDYYISVTLSQSSGFTSVTLFIDGVSDGFTVNLGGVAPTDPSFDIGNVPGFKGGQIHNKDKIYIQQLRLWDIIRTDPQILLWHDSELSDSEKLLATLHRYWRLNNVENGVLSEEGSFDLTGDYLRNVEGIVPGSFGAARGNVDAHGNGGLNLFYMGHNPAVLPMGPGYYADLGDQTWQFALKIDSLTTGTGSGDIMFLMDLGYARVEIASFSGMRFGVIDNAASDWRYYLEIFESGVSLGSITGATTITTATVHDIAVTCDDTGGSSTFNIYLDGASDVSGAFAQAAVATANPKTLGICHFERVGGIKEIDYTIDDIKLWDVVRTAIQIKNLGGEAFPNNGSEKSQIAAYWSLNGDNPNGFFGQLEDPTHWEDTNGNPIGINLHMNNVFASGTLHDSPGSRQFTWGRGLINNYRAPSVHGIHEYREVLGDARTTATSSGQTWELDEAGALMVVKPGAEQRAQQDTLTSSEELIGEVFYADGRSAPWMYDGVNTYPIAVYRPTAQILATFSGVGTDWPLGTYRYAYALISERDGRVVRSPLSTIQTQTTVADSLILNITMPEEQQFARSYDCGVTKVQFFVSKVNGTTLFESEFLDIESVTLVALNLGHKEEDLTIPVNEDIGAPPSGTEHIIERDNRMHYAKGRVLSFSEPEAPEEVLPLNFRTFPFCITGLSVMPNNDLVIWGRTQRYIINGDVSNLLTPVREYEDGGCLSHHSLENIGGSIYGLGPDGPFRSDGYHYVPIDEISRNGSVVGSIRARLLEVDKPLWNKAISSYNWDTKRWHLLIPRSTTGCRHYVLHVDISAWAEWDGELDPCVIGTTFTADGNAVKTYAQYSRGYLSSLDSDGWRDEIKSTGTSVYEVLSVDSTNESLTLTTTPDPEVLQSLALKWDDSNDDMGIPINQPVGGTAMRIFSIDGDTLYVNEDPASSVAIGDKIVVGHYNALYVSKRMTARTPYQHKTFRSYDFTANTASAGVIRLRLFGDTQGEQTAGYGIPVDLSDGLHHHIEAPLSDYALRMAFSSSDDVGMEIFEYSVEYDQEPKRKYS